MMRMQQLNNIARSKGRVSQAKLTDPLPNLTHVKDNERNNDKYKASSCTVKYTVPGMVANPNLDADSFTTKDRLLPSNSHS